MKNLENQSEANEMSMFLNENVPGFYSEPRPRGSVHTFRDLPATIFEANSQTLHVLAKLDRDDKSIPQSTRIWSLKQLGLQGELDTSALEDIVRSLRIWQDDNQAKLKRKREEEEAAQQLLLQGSGKPAKKARSALKEKTISSTFQNRQEMQLPASRQGHASSDMQIAKDSYSFMYHCQVCGSYSTENGQEMEGHRQRCGRSQALACTTCGCLQGQPNHIILNHQRLCTFDPERKLNGRRQIQCPFGCLKNGKGPHDVWFSNELTLLTHISKNHQNEERAREMMQARYDCMKCSRYLVGSDYIKHYRRCQTTPQQRNENLSLCNICKMLPANRARDFAFKNNEALQKHLKSTPHERASAYITQQMMLPNQSTTSTTGGP